MPKCFYPNGKPEQALHYNYQPCGQNTSWAQCCILGQDVCTEDGLCTHLTNDWSGCPQVSLDSECHCRRRGIDKKLGAKGCSLVEFVASG